MAKELALFDLDGTITTRDTMLEVIRFIKGNTAFLCGFAALSPVLAAYKFKVIPNWRAKEITLKWFFGGMQLKDFDQMCADFSNKKLEKLVRPAAREQLNWHKQQGHDIYIVSASAENWLKKWCSFYGYNLLATRLESVNNKITGKLSGNNCHDKEKVRRIKEVVDLSAYDCVWAYGDTRGDKPMLALANKASYKPFRS